MDLPRDAKCRRWRYTAWWRQRSFVDPDLGIDRHSGAQVVILVFSRIEDDLHRNALHDFYIGAGIILGRQQAETGTAGAGDAINLAFVASSVGIHVHGYRLAYSHVTQLGLLVISGNPNIVERNDLHQFLARNDVLADFDGAIADYPCHWSHNFGVLQIQLSLLEVGFLLLSLCLGRRGPGARGLHLLGGGLGVSPVGFGLQQFVLGLRHLRLRRIGQGAGSIDGSCIGGGASYGLIVLLQRDLLLIDELLVANQIVLRFDVVGFGLVALSFGCLELLPGGGDSGTRAGHIGLRR